MQIKGCKNESEKQEVGGGGGGDCGQCLLCTERIFLFSLDTQLDEVSQQGAGAGGRCPGDLYLCPLPQARMSTAG